MAKTNLKIFNIFNIGVLLLAMRRAGALALAVVLPTLLSATVARATSSYVVTDDTDSQCIGQLERRFVLSIPDLDYLGTLPGLSTLDESAVNGMAVYSGVVPDINRGIAFRLELRMSGKESCVVPNISSPRNCEQPDTYGCFSSWSGTLTGQPGSDFDGAVYSLTPRVVDPQTGETSVVIFGRGAYIFQRGLGFRGEFSAQLDDPASFLTLPGAMDGEFRFNLKSATNQSPLVADPIVVGTWEGTLDCIGLQGQSTGLLSTSDTSTAATLLIDGEGAELNGKTYCVNLPAFLNGSGGEGQLASPATLEPQGYVKYDGDTLKLRLLNSEGYMDNIDFCKGEFTRTDSVNPGVVVPGCGGISEIAPANCTLSSTPIDTDGDGLNDAFLSCDAARQEWCDTIVCGPGAICENQVSGFFEGGGIVECIF